MESIRYFDDIDHLNSIMKKLVLEGKILNFFIKTKPYGSTIIPSKVTFTSDRDFSYTLCLESIKADYRNYRVGSLLKKIN